jgi:hypothetical protein
MSLRGMLVERRRSTYIVRASTAKNVVVFEDADQINSHLVCRDFMKDYLIWAKHGEDSSTACAIENLVQET